ncbi:hypothetical protein ACNJOY_24820 [Citrobacter freundii]|uniref:hypothetical protein n=1 Tax=Citrobacter freundii TaxID=546 RepID=UPI003A8B6D31
MLYSPFSDSMVDWLSRDRVTVAIAANIQFESGTVYVHSGTGTLVLGGYVITAWGAWAPLMMPVKPARQAPRRSK